MSRQIWWINVIDGFASRAGHGPRHRSMIALPFVDLDQIDRTDPT
jgi:hypothetical protein